jgi:hypothetical protein
MPVVAMVESGAASSVLEGEQVEWTTTVPLALEIPCPPEFA